ncbi:MAG: DUF1580 domain-containing protein [Gemmataceae bacterium]
MIAGLRVLREKTIRLDRAARYLKVNVLSVRRWVKTGVLINGSRVRLEGQRVGGRYVTSVQAVRRFLAATDLPPPAPSAEPAVRTPAEASRAARRALEELSKMGVKITPRPKT